MIIRPRRARSIPSFLLPFAQTAIQTRQLHRRMPIPKIPPQTPFVPDLQTFLTLIGRNLSQYSSKIPTWEALFSLTSPQLKELGIEPPRSRRYLLRWREKFRNGEYGIGGDLKSVENAQAELRIVEVPSPHQIGTATTSPGKKKDYRQHASRRTTFRHPVREPYACKGAEAYRRPNHCRSIRAICQGCAGRS